MFCWAAQLDSGGVRRAWLTVRISAAVVQWECCSHWPQVVGGLGLQPAVQVSE
jgi:hypothetical protein